ncbi:alpha/beta-hydrolase [Aspergillus steynii IBT 23096]|uniref:Carboxylic ester hydrolase n=1 Tax=Aspergillus steynii IBT 23096 TaxID=1392250 RepID=A0A2I2GAJ1_9EURO|nr:alpha/beta-hydrolase [Aspergillus steynii IBT 23096]PLB49882.1 alpha/beta-hydrolase [Aspergillus steynii IBT 23096]
MDEDCLFVNVFSPSAATEASKLPVWVFIQGGGYAQNSNANYNGTTVIQESGHGIVFVTLNYRVGALGFLSSETVRENGDLNVGLLDQRMALRWVQEHISKFGGDPDHVVIHGCSAGAGSVTYHLAAYGGRDDDLFTGAIAQSPFWPTQRRVSDTEWQFNRFVKDAGCAKAPDALACLRSIDIKKLQAANIESPFPGTTDNPLTRWYFLPVIDDDLIVDRLYKLFDRGQFIKVPVMVGDDTDEGSYFAFNASTKAEMAQFFKNYYPNLKKHQLETINLVYKKSIALPYHAEYFSAASAAYGDATFTCPGNHIASTIAKHVSPQEIWNYRVNIQDLGNLAQGIGVPHTMENPAIFGPGSIGGGPSSFDTYNSAIVPVIMGYWLSFVRSLDPNPHRYIDAPRWHSWGSGAGQRMRLETNDTAMERVPRESKKKCEFWHHLAPAMEV